MEINAIITDVGNVLLDADARYLYDKMISDEKRRAHFLNSVLTKEVRSDWNYQSSAKAYVEELAKKHPEFEKEILSFYSRFNEMIKGSVVGMESLLGQIKNAGISIYGLTNWAGDTFKLVKEVSPILDLLDDILVSGDVGIKKPDKNFSQMAIECFQVNPQNTLFVDDKKANVGVAEELGMHGHIFTSADALRDQLVYLGVLKQQSVS